MGTSYNTCPVQTRGSIHRFPCLAALFAVLIMT